MSVEYDFWTGSLDSVLNSLNRSVAQYIRNHKSVKIGITNHPERRLKQHLVNRHWDKMIVKYKTTSVRNINLMEALLIERYIDYTVNQVTGGGGPNGEPPFYLYILVKHHSPTRKIELL